MPAGSKVAQVEKKLKKEYPHNPGAVYGTLNKAGLMHGNKPTAKGKQKAKKSGTKYVKTAATAAIRPDGHPQMRFRTVLD